MPDVQLINTELTRQFVVHMTTSFYVGLIVASPYIIFETAIAYEYGFDRLVDRVVCVYLEEEERLRRLQLRDHATREQLEARMRNQLSAEEKMMRADYVVLNYEGNPRSRQVQHIHHQLIATKH